MPYKYKVMGQEIELELDPSAVAVRFDDRLPRSARAEMVARSEVGPFARRYEVPDEKLTIVPVVATGADPLRACRAIDTLNAAPEIERANPVFRVDGNQVVASSRVIVGFLDAAAEDRLAQRHGLRAVRRWDDTVVFEADPDVNVFDLALSLDGEPGIAFAEPDLITIGRHVPRRTVSSLQPIMGDPLVPRQYAMSITRAVEAWQIAGGSPDVRIAVLDEGVDTTHPDLHPAIVGSYDGADGDSYQDPNLWDGHGTACAGLAAGVPGNDVGIRGSGGGCSILAVRIAYSAYKDGPWITSNQAISAAINWSWRNGAAVLSNSWGGGAPSNAIIQEFESARRLGRGGLGCVIVVAAGNEHRKVSFPGNLPDVLTVSASNQYDEAKTPGSRDGEKWWGTNYGPEIDVAAPGVMNLTTDNRGGAGYDPGDYDQNFNGTSSACPIVAGACGLLLSVRPDLTEGEVRRIIQKTAAKVGGDAYVGGRNDYFGEGRLDVLAALKNAMDR